jgi:putative oxidoreductase
MGVGTDLLALLGRIAMSAIFIQGGVRLLQGPNAAIASFARQGLPMPQAVYGLALFVELIAAAALVVGWKTRWAAFVLAAWCVATAVVVHYHPGDRGQMIHFMKNICMAGGFLQIIAFGAGRFSIDRR